MASMRMPRRRTSRRPACRSSPTRTPSSPPRSATSVRSRRCHDYSRSCSSSSPSSRSAMRCSVSVTLRAHELGTLRALGMTPGASVGIVATQALTIVGVAVVIGVPAGAHARRTGLDPACEPRARRRACGVARISARGVRARSRHRYGCADRQFRRGVRTACGQVTRCVPSSSKALAEGVGFEPTVSCPTHAFQACRFGRSRIPPERSDRTGTLGPASCAVVARPRGSGPARREPVNRVRSGEEAALSGTSWVPPGRLTCCGRASTAHEHRCRRRDATRPNERLAAGTVGRGQPVPQVPPAALRELVGQDHVTTALRNAVTEDRVGHAYLFSGPRGTGKTTTARLLARALNCLDLGADGEPCGKCENCVAIADGHVLRPRRARRGVEQRRRRDARPHPERAPRPRRRSRGARCTSSTRCTCSRPRRRTRC